MSPVQRSDREPEVALYDTQHNGENIPPEILVALSSFEKEANHVLSENILSSPSRAALHNSSNANAQRLRDENIPTIRGPQRQRGIVTPRHHEIDLATQLGRNLVEEVRKLQAQLHEKDEALRATTRSQERQAVVVDELEHKMKTVCVSEDKLKSTNWELELKVQDLEESSKISEQLRTRLENDLSRLESATSVRQDELETLREAEQSALLQIEDLRALNANNLAAQRRIQNDLREELETLQEQLEKVKTDLEVHKLDSLSRPNPTSPQKDLAVSMTYDEDLETPPGSPPLSPIKGTPHRNVTLESETLKGTLYYNQSKMLRQKKELEKEKGLRLQLQRQLQDTLDELENLRQLNGSRPARRLVRYKEASGSKRRSRNNDPFPTTRISTNNQTSSDNELWEDHEEGRHSDDEVSLRSDDSSYSALWKKGYRRSSISFDGNHGSYINGNERTAWDTSVHAGGSGSSSPITSAQRKPSPRSGTDSRREHTSSLHAVPMTLDAELDGLSSANSPEASRGSETPRTFRPVDDDRVSVPYVLTLPDVFSIEPIQKTYSDAAVMTELTSSNWTTSELAMVTLRKQVASEASALHTSESNCSLALFSQLGESDLAPGSMDEAHLDMADSSLMDSTVLSMDETHLGMAESSLTGMRDAATQYEAMDNPQSCLLCGECRPTIHKTHLVMTQDINDSGDDVSDPVPLGANLQEAVDTPSASQEASHRMATDGISGSQSSSTTCRRRSSVTSKKLPVLPSAVTTSIEIDPPESNVRIAFDTISSSMKISRAAESSPFANFNPSRVENVLNQNENLQTVGDPDPSVPSMRSDALVVMELELKASKEAIESLTLENTQLNTCLQERGSEEMDQVSPVLHCSTRARISRDLTSKFPMASNSPSKVSPVDPIKHGEQRTAVTTPIAAATANCTPMPDSPKVNDSSRKASPSKAERVLGISPDHLGLTSSKSISHSLRAFNLNLPQNQPGTMSMPPPQAPSTARDTIRGRQIRGGNSTSNITRDSQYELGISNNAFPMRSYSYRSMSSLSSFASDIEDRSVSRRHMPDAHSLVENSTDPATIESITRAMIGMSMYKYTRRAGRQGLSENRHKRYFWIHPYTKTLYWSVYNPVNAPEGAIIKSAPILDFYIEDDFNSMPPGLHQRSLLINTPRRVLKVTACHSVDHQDWTRSLNFLLYGPPPEDKTAEANEETETIIRDFSPTRDAAAVSQTYRSGKFDSQRTIKPRSNSQRSGHSERSLSRKMSEFFKSGMSPVRNFDIYKDRQTPERPMSVFEPPATSALTLDAVSMGDGLENVRACCGGKHDVSSLCTRQASPVRSSIRSRSTGAAEAHKSRDLSPIKGHAHKR